MILYTKYAGSCENDFDGYVYCKGVVRSLHPTHSVAACGAQASELVVLIDPPRAGLSGAMRATLRKSSARVLIYVSCDAQTLGRDLADMCGTEGAGSAFRLAKVTPVDLTPHAARVETVCLLWRPSSV